MVNRVQCPHCHAAFNASQEHIGQRAKCSRCGQAFVVSRDASNQPNVLPAPELHGEDNEENEEAVPPEVDMVECLYVHVTGSNLEIGNCDDALVELISLAIDGSYVWKIADEYTKLEPNEEVAIPLKRIPGFPVERWGKGEYQMKAVLLMTDSGQFTFHPERL